MISSGVIKTTYLKTIYRQEATSNIVKLADMVKEGNVDFNIFNKNEDLYYIPCQHNTVLSRVNNIIKYHVDNLSIRSFQPLLKIQPSHN